MTRFLLVLVSLALCVVSGFELNRRYQERQFLVLQTEPLNQADTMLVQQRWQEAKYLAHVVKERPALGDAPRAQSIEMAADSALESLPLQARAFLNGAVSGEAVNTSSLLGALTLDMFMIGDLRDLVVQGYKEIAYDEGDEVIMALSAAGLSLALLPGLHWAPAIMKSLKRAGALSDPFLKLLHKRSQIALETGDYKPLANILNDFGHATQNLGLGPVTGAMKVVESEADLAKLASASAINAKQSYAVATLAGTRGLKQLNKSGNNIGSVTKKLKVSSRLAKSAKKSFSSLPDSTILAIFLLGITLLLATRTFKRKRRTA